VIGKFTYNDMIFSCGKRQQRRKHSVTLLRQKLSGQLQRNDWNAVAGTTTKPSSLIIKKKSYFAGWGMGAQQHLLIKITKFLQKSF